MALKSPFDDGPCTVKFLTFDGTSWTEIFSALLAANSTSSDFTYSGYGATNTARFVVTPDGIVQLQGDDTVDGGARGPAARCAIRIIPSVAIPSSPSAQAQYIGALSTTSNDFTSTAFFFGVKIFGSREYGDARSPLSLALGKDIGGRPVVVDLQKMPHLLVAGTTGSGKSVALNAMVLSLLFKARPADVRMIMIDPKMLELSVYDRIPHLLAPVVTDMKEAANALRWCVAEMERRYKLMAAVGVRNLAGFNKKVKDAENAGQPLLDPLFRPVPEMPNLAADPLEPLPNIVVIIDEFADMMMIVGKKVEELIARLAQKARAAGVHLILATQRPSVDVITGLIKANIPTRIAFQVSSKIDSRTILDQSGAEALLGHGDMLYLPPGTATPERVHGAFVDDHEVHGVVNWLKSQGEPDYVEGVLEEVQATSDGKFINDAGLPLEGEEGGDADTQLYDKAVAVVTQTRRASISGVQRHLRIGYNRAARLVEQMEADGVVSAPQHNGNREVLAPPPPKN